MHIYWKSISLCFTCLKHIPPKKKWPIMKIQDNMKETPIRREGKKSDLSILNTPRSIHWLPNILLTSHSPPLPSNTGLIIFYMKYFFISQVIVYVCIYSSEKFYLKSDKSKSSMKPVHYHILYKYGRQRNVFHVKI